MKIWIIIEGKTEWAFIPHLRKYLSAKLQGKLPSLRTDLHDGRIPTGDKLRRTVHELMKSTDDHVIALTDVYTGSRPPDFLDAADAKQKMSQWVGDEPRFHPHAAQYDFEAWLLPYWSTIQKLAGHNKTAPGYYPETVNHQHPPSHHIKDIFRMGSRHKDYIKPRDASRILRDNDLSVAIDMCPELKAFVNTILSLCGGTIIP